MGGWRGLWGIEGSWGDGGDMGRWKCHRRQKGYSVCRGTQVWETWGDGQRHDKWRDMGYGGGHGGQRKTQGTQGTWGHRRWRGHMGGDQMRTGEDVEDARSGRDVGRGTRTEAEPCLSLVELKPCGQRHPPKRATWAMRSQGTPHGRRVSEC